MEMPRQDVHRRELSATLRAQRSSTNSILHPPDFSLLWGESSAIV
jgi:hypothetical protein